MQVSAATTSAAVMQGVTPHRPESFKVYIGVCICIMWSCDHINHNDFVVTCDHQSSMLSYCDHVTVTPKVELCGHVTACLIYWDLYPCDSL